MLAIYGTPMAWNKQNHDLFTEASLTSSWEEISILQKWSGKWLFASLVSNLSCKLPTPRSSNAALNLSFLCPTWHHCILLSTYFFKHVRNEKVCIIKYSIVNSHLYSALKYSNCIMCSLLVIVQVRILSCDIKPEGVQSDSLILWSTLQQLCKVDQYIITLILHMGDSSLREGGLYKAPGELLAVAKFEKGTSGVGRSGSNSNMSRSVTLDLSEE